MPDDESVTLTVRLPVSMRVSLEERAEDTCQSVAQVVREAIREWYEIPEPERAKIIRRHRKARKGERDD